MTPYSDPIISKYFDLIKSKSGIFKEFYQGDPIRIPNSKLPALVISKSQTLAGQFTNVQDEHGLMLILTVITDIRDEINDEAGLVAGIAKLYDILEGREADYKLKATSLLHILRNNLIVDSTYGLRTDLDTITTVDYGMTVGKRAPEAWGIEAQIKFAAHFVQIR